MTTAYLVPCLVQLRYEFNRLNPHRDKSSDGWIGDAAHQATTSDHNPDGLGRVLAVDVDRTGPWPAGVTFDDCVDLIIGRCRSGREDRLEYVIWDRQIWSRSYGWVTRPYTGSSPHTEHGHFSARHDHHGQSDTRGWNLLSLLPEEPIMAQVSIDSDSVQRIASKMGLDLNNDVSGVAAGTRRQVDGALVDNFAAVNATLAAIAADVAVIKDMVLDLEHDPADGGRTAIQQAVRDSVTAPS